jgi:CRP-like cAMP-binding protein
VNLLRSAVQEGLRALPDSGRLASLQRCTTLYEQGQAADAVFLIEDGLVKLTHADGSAGKIILSICGPGQIVGEEALAEEQGTYYVDAVTITVGTCYRIPRSSVLSMLRNDGELGSALVSYLLKRKLDLAKKVELLCLRDVEHRILYYLAELSGLLPQVSNGDGYQIPITQLELADLIGATRETTSTTLNQLERRGLLKLSRRLLTVPSPDLLRGAANTRVSSKSEPPRRREIAHSAGAVS